MDNVIELKKQWTPRVSPEELKTTYEIALAVVREVARNHGYAIGLHGSQQRDLDLIAVPWIRDCSSMEVLVESIAKELNWVVHKDIANKAHGRKGYTIFTANLVHIDLSVMPRYV